MYKMLNFIKKYWSVLTSLIIFAITLLSLYPLDNLPDVPGSDKTHHFIAYAALAFPVAFAKPQKWLLYLLSYLIYSGVIELIQPYVNRYAEWLDFAANASGIVIGIFLAWLANQFFDKKQLN